MFFDQNWSFISKKLDIKLASIFFVGFLASCARNSELIKDLELVEKQSNIWVKNCISTVERKGSVLDAIAVSEYVTHTNEAVSGMLKLKEELHAAATKAPSNAISDHHDQIRIDLKTKTDALKTQSCPAIGPFVKQTAERKKAAEIKEALDKKRRELEETEAQEIRRKQEAIFIAKLDRIHEFPSHQLIFSAARKAGCVFAMGYVWSEIDQSAKFCSDKAGIIPKIGGPAICGKSYNLLCVTQVEVGIQKSGCGVVMLSGRSGAIESPFKTDARNNLEAAMIEPGKPCSSNITMKLMSSNLGDYGLTGTTFKQFGMGGAFIKGSNFSLWDLILKVDTSIKSATPRVIRDNFGITKKLVEKSKDKTSEIINLAH